MRVPFSFRNDSNFDNFGRSYFLIVRRISGKVAAQPAPNMKFCIWGQFYMLNIPGVVPHQIFDWHHLKILCFLVCKAKGAEPLTLSLQNFF